MQNSREIASRSGSTRVRRARAPVIWLSIALLSLGVIYSAVSLGWYSYLDELIDTYNPLIMALSYGQILMKTMGYPGLVAIIFVENVFPPIPSDVILPLAGFTAATGSMSFIGAVAATTAGSLLGAIVLYQVGALLGEHRVRRFVRRYGRYLTFEEAEFDRSLDWFRRHGAVVVMVARVVPVFRSLISIPAGVSRMPLGRFLFFTALGAAAWNSSLISAGYWLGSNWETAIVWLDNYQLVMLAANSSIFMIFAGYRVRVFRRRRAIDLAQSETSTDEARPDQLGRGEVNSRQ